MLDHQPVQSFHNSTVNFRVHASVTFLVYGDEKPLLMGCFLKRLETSPFHKKWFCMCTVNRLSHAFPHTWDIFTNGALILKIYSACSFANGMFSSGNFEGTSSASCLSRKHKAFLRANLYISVFRACTTLQKVASVSSSPKVSATLRKNRKGCVCCCFHEWQNQELWEATCISGTPFWFSWFSGRNMVET